MGISVNSLESVIEVKMSQAIADLRAFDALHEEVARHAEQAGQRIKKAYDGSAQPAQSAAQSTQKLRDEITQLTAKVKDLETSMSRGGASALESNFKASSDGVKRAGDEIASSAERMTRRVGQSNSVLKESVESVTSEIIESWGIDGDVANMLANMLVAAGPLKGLFNDLSNIKPPTEAVNASARAFDLFRGSVTSAGGSTRDANQLIATFKETLLQAAAGNKEVAKTFEAVGVNIEQGLKRPEAAFTEFLRGFAKLDDVKKGEIAVGTFLGEAEQIVPVLNQASAAVGVLETGLTSVAAEATVASSALGPVGLAIGAVVAVALVGAVATAALGVAYINLAKQGSDLGGAMADLSNNTGIATESLSLYKIEAEKSGSSLESITSTISRLEKKLQDAASGQNESAKLFAVFGINAKKAAEEPQAAFDKLAVSIAGIEDPSLRAKAATEVFGESGTKLISTFITMRDEGKELKARMQDLGLTLSGDVASGADAVGDEFVILSAISDSLKIKIANELAPDVIRAIQTVENALVAIGPTVISIGSTILDMFTATVNAARASAAAIEGFFANVSWNPAKTVIGGISGALKGFKTESDAIRGEAQTAQDAEARKVLDQALKNAGMDINGNFVTDKPNAQDQKLKEYLASLNNKKKGSKAGQNEITPVDTISSTKQLRDAELSLEESKARASIGIAKAEADEKRKILEMQHADGLVNTRSYFDQRFALESAAIDREIAEQQRIIELEKQRQQDAKADLRAEIERINELAAAKQAKAKTSGQKEKITEDRDNRITNAINQAEAERERRLGRQIQAEAKITELQAKRAGQAAATTRDEIKANEALEKSFAELISSAQRATGNEYDAAATEIGQKFADKIALAIREGRPDVIEAIKTLTAVELNKAKAAESGKRLDVAESGLAEEQARIQRELNEGVISEVTARKQQLAAQERARQAIITELQLEKDLAVARGDASTAARLSVEIEKSKGLGREEDPNVRNLREALTNDFDSFEKALVYGQKTIGEALRELARSTITNILEQIQTSIVENLTGEKTIGAALAKAISGKLAGVLKIGQKPDAGLPGIAGDATGKMVIKNLQDNAQTVSKSVEDAANKTMNAARQAAQQQAQELAKIAQSNMEMANCACAAPQGPSLLGTILSAAIGAVGAGFAGGVKLPGGKQIGVGSLPDTGDAIISPGIINRRDGGLASFADAEGMRNGGHAGTPAGRAAIGAMVRGPGGPRDDKIPMWLSNGEYVSDADTVQRLGPGFFRALPTLAKAGKMADGGIVASAPVGAAYATAGRPLPMMVAEGRTSQPAKPSLTVVNNFTIQAPRGSVTKETQQQIATKAAKGMNAAMARNT